MNRPAPALMAGRPRAGGAPGAASRPGLGTPYDADVGRIRRLGAWAALAGPGAADRRQRGLGLARLGLVPVLLVSVLESPGLAHDLPTFPRVRLVAVLDDPGQAGRRVLVLQVRDPAGRDPVVGAEVVVSGLEQERGSAVRLGEQWLAPTPEPGTYQGSVAFPGRGVWDVTLTVRGRYVGEAHVQVTVTGDLPRAATRGGPPDLAFGWPGWRFLLLTWGHLLGFGLWFGVTALALATPVSPRATVGLTWLALAAGVGTGFNKMEYGTPFPRGLRLFHWDAPPIFFGQAYLETLTVKHALILAAVAVTAVMTRHAWQADDGGLVRRFRRLLLLVLAIGGAAAVLGFLHAIVLHFA